MKELTMRSYPLPTVSVRTCILPVMTTPVNNGPSLLPQLHTEPDDTVPTPPYTNYTISHRQVV